MVWLTELPLMVVLLLKTPPENSPDVHITSEPVTTEPLGTLQEREMEVVDKLIVVILGWPGTGIIDTEIEGEGDKQVNQNNFLVKLSVQGPVNNSTLMNFSLYVATCTNVHCHSITREVL